ncbi:hypothetical protein Dda_8852 [Drechslerella dactyloides]|uniref:SAM-dependent MTase RsmB/NOP-type domain-containing protein n=1 Tax=Drechslerella dactyloides TaxID=74499 RepID=A0AAD6IR71_DREDA|nr:hypothetical protein Dda_8852 [Drechslerella dactyloides]
MHFKITQLEGKNLDLDSKNWELAGNLRETKGERNAYHGALNRCMDGRERGRVCYEGAAVPTRLIEAPTDKFFLGVDDDGDDDDYGDDDDNDEDPLDLHGFEMPSQRGYGVREEMDFATECTGDTNTRLLLYFDYRFPKLKHRHRDNDNRTDYTAIEKENANFKAYYRAQGIISDDEEFQKFWASLKETLPTTWRFTGSKGHAVGVRDTLLTKHIPALTNTTFDGAAIPAPTPLPWYPDQLAWQLTVGKQVIRRSPPFKQLQAFLVSETSSGNISRQEAVSMIPPLLMDVESHHTVLDMCAAPGSKTAQLIEAVHSGEEDRVAESAKRLNGVLARLAEASKQLDNPTAVDNDVPVETGEAAERLLGRSTGLVIANDADYKRSHLLIHQTKRLNTPNFIVTNYDATLYPPLRLAPLPAVDGKKPQQQYLKFDRVLCDVPCSGDGTVRKNPLVWRDWNVSNGNGLWSTQARILVRGLQLLKVGGRLVYSTCSLNPVENEAVVHAAIERCGGADVVEVVDVSDRLPGLARRDGLTKWKVMDRDGTWFETWDEVRDSGIPYTDRLTRGMFPPEEQEGETADMLKRAVRVYPHLQDTGGFFIAVLRKKGPIKAAPEGEKVQTGGQKMKGVGVEGTDAPALADVDTPMVEAVPSNGVKRALGDEEEADPGSPTKRQKLEEPSPAKEEESDNPAPLDIPSSNQNAAPKEHDDPKETIHKKPRGNFNEEPFKYLQPTHAVLAAIRQFYDVSRYFPQENFMVRNAEGIPVRTIYYTSCLARQILTHNEGRGVRFVHCGVKMFNKQEVQDPEACQWRIQNEGLPIIESWVGERRVVYLRQKETLRWLMKELFPRVEDCPEIKERMESVGGGCCVLRVEIEGLDGLVLPLWKSRYTLNLMLPKEERRAMLLRLFDDTEGPMDSTKEQREADARARKEAGKAAEPVTEEKEEEDMEAKDEDEKEDVLDDDDEQIVEA